MMLTSKKTGYLFTGSVALLLLIFYSCSKDSKNTIVPAPTITSISQNIISPGETFTISGENFNTTAANDLLKLGATTVVVTSATATSLSATLPVNFTTGSYEVSVTVNGKVAKLTGSIDVVPATPSITSFSPAGGSSGTTVTVTGTNFDPTPANNIVTLNNSSTPVAVTASTATSLTFAIPASSNGIYTINVKVKQNNETSSAATSATGFVVVADPSLTSFSPSTASADEIVTLVGSNFDPTPANNVVLYGGIAATVVSATTTQLQVKVPKGLNSGTGYVFTITVSIGGFSSNPVYTTALTYHDYTVGLVAYYKFAGDTKDYSGQGNDLAPTNITFGPDQHSTANSAAVFDGTSSKALSSTGTNLNSSSAASISVWFNGVSTNAWTMFYSTDVRLLVYDAGGGKTGIGQCNPCSATTVSTVSRNSWHHLVGLYDETNATLTLYIDNTLVSSSPAASIGTLGFTFNWLFGYYTSGAEYWQGSIGKTRIYNRILTTNEINQLYPE